MNNFTPLPSAVGGMLIGLAVALTLLYQGRVAGISGIVGGILGGLGAGERRWRLAFVAGLLVGGVALRVALPGAFEAQSSAPSSLGRLAVAGLLVGFGTRLGGGCTSGHGVCGLSRLSSRSLVATLTFMVTAAIVVYVTHHLVAASAS